MIRLAALLPRVVQRPGDRRLRPLQRTGDAPSGPGRWLPVLLAVLVVAAATPARSDEAVAVRAGIHPGFGRLVLEWPAPVEVEDRQEDDRYWLRFERPLKAVLDPALARLSEYLESARLSSDGRLLALVLAPGIAVRQTVQARRIVVLDLMPTPPAAEVEVRTGLHDGFGRIVFDWPVPTAFDAVTTDRQVAIRFNRAGHIDATRPATRLGAWLANASASGSNGRSEVRLEMRPGVSARVFKVDANRVAVDLSAAPAPLADAGAAVAVQAAAPARPSIRSTLAADPDPAASPPDYIESKNLTTAPGVSDGAALLDFAWARPVAAAVFVRAGHLWVVFGAETSRPEDLAVPPPLRDHLGEGERIEARGGTALRFRLHRPLSAEVRREDRTWRVRLGADAQAPRPLYPLRLASPARLRLAPGEVPRLVDLRDPETGEQLTIWPLRQANSGQPRQSFVELELLATAQGLAWRLRSDRVRAGIVGEAIEFDAPGGLALSEIPGSEAIAPTVPAQPSGSEPVAPAVAAEPPGETTARTPAAAADAPAAQAGPTPEPRPDRPRAWCAHRWRGAPARPRRLGPRPRLHGPGTAQRSAAGACPGCAARARGAPARACQVLSEQGSGGGSFGRPWHRREASGRSEAGARRGRRAADGSHRRRRGGARRGAFRR